jgi:hypothetical protein
MGLDLFKGFGLEPSWLSKALSWLPESPALFAAENRTDAASILGMGTCKVEALKNYLLLTGLADKDDRRLVLTELGNTIRAIDPELKSDNSWWEIYFRLCSNENAEIFYWYACVFTPDRFDRATLAASAYRYFRNNQDPVRKWSGFFDGAQR